MVIALVLLCGIMLFGAIAVARTPNPSPSEYLSAYGLASVVGMQLLSMLRTESGLTHTRHSVLGALDPVVANTDYVARKIEPMAQSAAVVAEKLTNGNAPISRHDLEQMLPPIVEKIVVRILEERERP